MKRRQFVTLFAGAAAAAWSVAARAQQPPSPRRIGVLMLYPEKDPQGELRANVFQRELEKAGWRIGGNLQIDFHWGTGNADWSGLRLRRYCNKRRMSPWQMAMQRPMPHKNRLKPSPLFLSAAAIPSAMAWFQAWRIPAATDQPQDGESTRCDHAAKSPRRCR